jgi:mannan endo-1,4-beta-mannosidase
MITLRRRILPVITALACAAALASAGRTAAAAPMGDGPASRLLAYLRDLDRGDGRRVLSGQHADIWNADPWSTAQPMLVVDPLAPETGNNPSILGLVLNYATNSGAYEVSVSEALANLWWSKGGLVMLSLYDNDPTHSYNSTGAPIGRPIPAAAFHSLTDEYSAAYRQWHSQLDTYAAALHALTDSGRVALFRPFIEINGNWNWYGAEDPADFIAIWRDMHDYLTLTKGVRNLLWLYDVNQDVGRYLDYYPGASYVDLVGMDIYNPQPTSDPANATMYAGLRGTGKPLIIPEIGLGYAGPPDHTRDDRVIIDSIKGAYPDVVGFVVFNGSFAICNQNDAAALMNDPWVIDLAELPREP